MTGNAACILLPILVFICGIVGAFAGSLARSHRYDPATRSLVLRDDR